MIHDSTIPDEERQFLDLTVDMIVDDPSAEVLINDSNLFEQVYFKKVSYFKPSTKASGYGLGIIKTGFENAFLPMGGTVETLDSKMIRSSTTQILKGKFKIEVFGLERYWTQYFITVDNWTASVLAFNESGEDFEESIKGLSVF